MSALQLHDSKMDSKTELHGSAGKRERNQNIQVYVRVRPMTPGGQVKVIETPGVREVVVRERSVANITKTFTFDKVFNTESTQLDVYDTVVSPLLKEVLLGYNCTVFAYGQTGTGKTYTMEGELNTTNTMLFLGVDGKDAGILPRALSDIFDEVRAMSCDFQVRASYLELYNEELFDLLATVEPNPNQTKKTLRIYEDANRKGSVVIQGLEEVIVQNKQEVYNVLRRGSQHRKTASTVLNHSSSRSHAVFTITVHMKESNVDGEEMVKVGKLHLVDLAGSENIGKSGAVDKRAREAGSINQSLLTLGRVITALVERAPHVPYRESKLTRLLQDSLGGKTKTSIIATISPAQCNIEETLSTLDYAHRAKNIMNKPEVNQRLTKREALSIYTEEIERLRKDLMAARDGAGFFIDLANYNMMQNQIASLNLELVEKNNSIQGLKETIEKKEEELVEEALKIVELTEDNYTKRKMLEKAHGDNVRYQARLAESFQRADELEHLLRAQAHTERKLSSEAGCLLRTTKDTVSTIEALHKRLDRKKQVEDANQKHTKRFRKDLDDMLNNVVSTLHQAKEKHVLQVVDIMRRIDERKPMKLRLTDGFQERLTTSLNDFITLSETTITYLDNLKSGVSSTLSNANMRSLDEADTGVKNMTQMKESLAEMLQSMKTQFGTMKTDIAKLKTMMAKEFDELEEQVKAVLVHDMDEFSRLETVLMNVKSNFKTLADEFEGNDRFFELRQDKYKERYQHKMDLILKSLEELKMDTDEYFDGTADAHKQLMGKFNVSKVDCDTMLSNEVKTLQASKAVPEKLSSNFTQFREKNVTAHQKQLSNLHEKIDFRIQASRQIEKQVNAVATTHSDMIYDRLNYMTKHNEEIELALNYDIERINPTVENIRAGLASVKTSANKMLKGLTASELEFTQSLRDVTNEGVTQLSTNMESATSEVKKISGFQNEFWESNYLHDAPTGATPMKREYQYPTSLSATSPHEQVVKRYRMVSKRIQETLLECESGSGSSSEANTVVSESGDDSSLSEEERQRKESEAKVLAIEAHERHEQQRAWGEQEIKRRVMHRKAQMELDSGTPLKDLLQELGRPKTVDELQEQENKDALLVLKGEVEVGKHVKTICKAPKITSSPNVEEKENAEPNPVPAPASSNNKKRRNSGQKKKKGRD
ncbi:unnamed protein product [Orchesella dallaii]|uniref:Kinesin motor domain-containing protein n=1 Tax=Orchesella dallaii TaxID=48710 RepID=A0ABP1QZC0_9HEXA